MCGMENGGIPHELITEINDVGKPVFNEMDERGLAAVAFGPNSTPDEVATARAELISRGFDPDFVDGINQRRDLDNPLSAAQSYEQMLSNKQRHSGEDSSL